MISIQENNISNLSNWKQKILKDYLSNLDKNISDKDNKNVLDIYNYIKDSLIQF